MPIASEAEDEALWAVRIEWSRKIAKVLRSMDVQEAVELVTQEIQRSGMPTTNGELMVRVLHDLADRIELLPHSMREDDEENPDADHV